MTLGTTQLKYQLPTVILGRYVTYMYRTLGSIVIRITTLLLSLVPLLLPAVSPNVQHLSFRAVPVLLAMSQVDQQVAVLLLLLLFLPVAVSDPLVSSTRCR